MRLLAADYCCWLCIPFLINKTILYTFPTRVHPRGGISCGAEFHSKENQQVI